jgi:hypothetical protein
MNFENLIFPSDAIVSCRLSAIGIMTDGQSPENGLNPTFPV